MDDLVSYFKNKGVITGLFVFVTFYFCGCSAPIQFRSMKNNGDAATLKQIALKPGVLQTKIIRYGELPNIIKNGFLKSNVNIVSDEQDSTLFQLSFTIKSFHSKYVIREGANAEIIKEYYIRKNLKKESVLTISSGQGSGVMHAKKTCILEFEISNYFEILWRAEVIVNISHGQFNNRKTMTNISNMILKDLIDEKII